MRWKEREAVDAVRRAHSADVLLTYVAGLMLTLPPLLLLLLLPQKMQRLSDDQ
jgi:hypothetical protein